LLLRNILAGALLCCCPFANAQTVSGLVTDEKQTAINEAVVTLCRPADSSITTTSHADKNGHYSLPNKDGRAILKAEAKGYITEWREINATTTITDFILRKDNTLNEVVVAAGKPVIENKADRTIFNIENSVAANAGDAYTALKKTPGVQVMQNQIMLSGKGGVSIMLNGRLQQLSGDDLVQFLRSVPSAQLSKIEVITAPGVKYDAEGTNGIINLVTKKNLNKGLRGNVSAACTRNMYYSPSGSVSLQYRSGKLNLFSNNSYSQWNWLYTGITTVFFGNERINQVNNTAYSTTNGRIHLGGDYALTPKTTIGFSYAKGFGGSDNDGDIRAVAYSGNWNADSVTHTRGNTHERYKGRHTANLNYEWRIDSAGKKLNIDADYFAQATDMERNFAISRYNGAETSLKDISDNRIYSYSSVTIRTLKSDLELPYPFVRLAVGAKASFVNNEGSFQYLTKTAEDYKPDSGKANRFLFDEQIQAAYISGKKTLEKLDVQLGLRVERTYNKGYTPATKEIFTRDYTQAFPSLNLRYQINDKHSLALNYMRRINRPGYNLLNPFRFYLSPTSFVEGNAGLQPSFSNAADLTWFIGQEYFLRFRVTQTHNYWDRLYFTDSVAGTTTLTRANVGEAVYYGLNFNWSRSLTKWWDVQGFIGIEYSRFTLFAYGQNRFFSGVNGWGDLSNTFYLNHDKTIVAELHCHYYTPRQKDYKRWEEMSVFDGGVKAMLLNKNLTIGLYIEDPFKKAYWDQTNQVNGTEEFSYDNAFLGTLSITYKFGSTSLKAKKDRSEANEEIQRAR